MVESYLDFVVRGGGLRKGCSAGLTYFGPNQCLHALPRSMPRNSSLPKAALKRKRSPQIDGSDGSWASKTWENVPKISKDHHRTTNQEWVFLLQSNGVNTIQEGLSSAAFAYLETAA